MFSTFEDTESNDTRIHLINAQFAFFVSKPIHNFKEGIWFCFVHPNRFLTSDRPHIHLRIQPLGKHHHP